MTILRRGLFDFRQVRYTFARKPSAILKSARIMLGASQTDVLRVLNSAESIISNERYKMIEGDLEGQSIGAVEWWLLCKCLAIPNDIYELGYSARCHITNVRGDIVRGEFRLLISPILGARLAAFKEWEELERKPRMVYPGLHVQAKSGSVFTRNKRRG